MKSGFRILIVILFWGVLLSLTACEWELSGQKRENVLSFSEALADNLFAGLAAGDYRMFSRDFDENMLNVLPAARFEDWLAQIDEHIGGCRSRHVERVTRSDEFYVVTYQVDCSLAPLVMAEIAFHAAEPHTIAHLSIASGSLALVSQ